MGAIAVPTHSVLGFTNFSPNLGKHTSLRLGAFGVEENRKVVTALWCIGSDGNRRGRRITGRSSNRDNDDDEDENKTNQEELIAIFKRIQTSIANEDSSVRTKSKPGSDVSEKKSPAPSILSVLRRAGSNNQEKGNNKALMRRRVVPKIEQQRIEDYPPRLDSNLIRPVSKFVKRSPIPYPSTPRKISHAKPDTKMEGMKLVELKELAKSRGIKGYSKLKKNELIDLLLRSPTALSEPLT